MFFLSLRQRLQIRRVLLVWYAFAILPSVPTTIAPSVRTQVESNIAVGTEGQTAVRMTTIQRSMFMQITIGKTKYFFITFSIVYYDNEYRQFAKMLSFVTPCCQPYSYTPHCAANYFFSACLLNNRKNTMVCLQQR